MRDAHDVAPGREATRRAHQRVGNSATRRALGLGIAACHRRATRRNRRTERRHARSRRRVDPGRDAPITRVGCGAAARCLRGGRQHDDGGRSGAGDAGRRKHARAPATVREHDLPRVSGDDDAGQRGRRAGIGVWHEVDAVGGGPRARDAAAAAAPR